MDDLVLVARLIREASFPHEVFGVLSGTAEEQLAELKKLFRRLSRKVHPDHNSAHEKELATEAFQQLNKLYDAAQQAINTGVYGATTPPPTAEVLVVRSKKREYMLREPIASGDFANLYHATYRSESGGEEHATFKVAHTEDDNDLLEREAKALSRFANPPDPNLQRFSSFVPGLVETFGYKEVGGPVRRVNIISTHADGLYSLKDVRKHYPDGVDPKDMAWMFRRLMTALGYAHECGVVHGAVLPTHILIQPADHGLVLIDWACSAVEPAKTGETIPAVSSEFEAWYPPEVFAKESPLPGLDLYMGVLSMLYVMGVDPVKRDYPASVPQSLRNFFRGCLLSGPRARPQDAWALRREFDELIERLWGKRKFRPFNMSSTR